MGEEIGGNIKICSLIFQIILTRLRTFMQFHIFMNSVRGMESEQTFVPPIKRSSNIINIRTSNILTYNDYKRYSHMLLFSNDVIYLTSTKIAIVLETGYIMQCNIIEWIRGKVDI